MELTQPKKIYDSDKRRPHAIEELLALYRYKDLIYQLIRRDLVTRYKRSFLGIAWTMLNPLGTMIIMTIVFSQLFSRTENYPVYVLSGLIAWNFFSQSTRACMTSMLWGSTLFDRIYLPRTSFVVSAIGTGIINVLFSLIPLFLIMVFTHVSIRLSIFLLPLSILLLAAFSLGVGLILSTYVVFFPDISEMYPIVLTAWMYLTPIIVPEQILANVLNGAIIKFNPLFYQVKIFRMVLFQGETPDSSTLIIAAVISFATLIVGWFIFSKRSDEFVYYV